MLQKNNPLTQNIIIDIASSSNVHRSYLMVLKNKTINLDTIKFQANYTQELEKIQKELLTNTYYPNPPFTFIIRDPKVRQISSLKIKDMVVQRAILNMTQNFLKKIFIHDSYGGLPEKGPRKAIARAQSFIRKNRFYLKSDISHFYDSIDHEILNRLLGKLFKHQKSTHLNEIFKRIIGYTGKGIPIGALLSQYFGNLYLTPLDNYLKCYKGIKGYIRYMDDFVLFHHDRKYLEDLKCEVMSFLQKKLKIEINVKVTRIDSTINGVDFLGFRIYPQQIRVKRSNMVRIRKKIKKIFLDFQDSIITLKMFKQKLSSYINHLTIGDTHNHNKKMLNRLKHTISL